MMPRGVSRMVRGKEQERTETRSRLRSIYNSDRVYDSAMYQVPFNRADPGRRFSHTLLFPSAVGIRERGRR